MDGMDGMDNGQNGLHFSRRGSLLFSRGKPLELGGGSVPVLSIDVQQSREGGHLNSYETKAPA